MTEGHRRVSTGTSGELHEAQVAVAGACAADAHEHLTRSRIGLGYLVESRGLIDLDRSTEKLERLHDSP